MIVNTSQRTVKHNSAWDVLKIMWKNWNIIVRHFITTWQDVEKHLACIENCGRHWGFDSENPCTHGLTSAPPQCYCPFIQQLWPFPPKGEGEMSTAYYEFNTSIGIERSRPTGISGSGRHICTSIISLQRKRVGGREGREGINCVPLCMPRTPYITMGPMVPQDSATLVPSCRGPHLPLAILLSRYN